METGTSIVGRQFGFGLIEVMVSVGILGVIAVGIMRLTDTGMKSQADINAKQAARELKDSFYYAIKSSDCGLLKENEIFKGARAPVTGETEVDIKIDVTKAGFNKVPQLIGMAGIPFTPGRNYGNISLDANEPFGFYPPSQNSPIVDVLIPSTKTAGGFYPTSNANEYLSEFSIKIRKGAGAGGMKTTPPIRFPAIITLDTGGNLIKCRSIADINTARESCEMMEAAEGSPIEFQWVDGVCRVGMNSLPQSDGAMVYPFNASSNAFGAISSQYKFP